MVPKNFKFYEVEEAYYEWITRNSIVYRRDTNELYE